MKQAVNISKGNNDGVRSEGEGLFLNASYQGAFITQGRGRGRERDRARKRERVRMEKEGGKEGKKESGSNEWARCTEERR